jgi:hypothetical protein
VIGTPYQYSSGGLQVLPATDDALSYHHRGLGWFLASQMVCRLRAYTIVSLNDHPVEKPKGLSTARPDWMPGRRCG